MPRPKLSDVPLEALQKEILRRRKLLPKLIATRDALNRQIAELQGLGASSDAPAATKLGQGRKSPAGKVRRAKNKISLVDALAEALKGKASLGVADATEAVLAAGYETTSKSFRSIVNQTLYKDKRFKSKGRGKYALKK